MHGQQNIKLKEFSLTHALDTLDFAMNNLQSP